MKTAGHDLEITINIDGYTSDVEEMVEKLIAEEYDRDTVHSQWVSDNTESYYMHLIGGPEPERKSGIPKWTQHGRYNKFPNSESELVEFLKEVQRESK